MLNMKNQRQIGIIGGGASGVFAAIRIKENHPSYQVTIIERNDQLLKKILVTGNGRCNYANTGDTKDKYHNDAFAQRILSYLPAFSLINKLEEYGVHPYQIDDLVYPTSLSAQTVVFLLLKRLEELNIRCITNEQFVDYEIKDEQFIVETNKNHYQFDQLIIACGGQAYPQLGTDGSVFNILKKHHYHIVPLSPSLCPIKVYENTKKIAGLRCKCLVNLYEQKQLYYQEEGEVLFKDDGLSGIVILNMSQKINMLENKKDVQIVLDLIPHKKNITPEQYIEYVHPKIAQYLLSNHLDIKAVTFNFKDFYPFNVAEVSSGGLDINEINNRLESNKEKGLYFIGEALDVDAMCGGYNLMFAFASGELVSQEVK